MTNPPAHRPVQFGCAYEVNDEEHLCRIPVDRAVQQELRNMRDETLRLMRKSNETPPRYEPSEKYSGKEHVTLPLNDPHATRLASLYAATNIDINTAVLNDPSSLIFYFAIFEDAQGQKVIALRRATYFRGLVKKPLISLIDDALSFHKTDIFKLDNDFDLLITADTIHILRPSAFEAIGKLKEALLAAVDANIQDMQDTISFVDFDSIATYAQTRSRAARLLASISSREDLARTCPQRLKSVCHQQGVQFSEDDGQLIIAESHEMTFLEILDRRRYRIELVPDKEELFRAASRTLV